MLAVGAGRLGIARLGIVAARRSSKGKAGIGQRRLHFVRQRYANLGAGCVVEDDRMQAGLVGMIGVVPLVSRTMLAQRGGAEALVAGHLQHGLFAEIVAFEM